MSKTDTPDNKNSFIFYEDWLKAIESLQEELRLEMFLAIARYALYGEEPKNPNIALIMNFVRQTIDRNADKYAGRCESNRINGGIGGKKRAENLAKKKLEANQANATNLSETKQTLQIQATQANQADNDNDSVNDNDNDNVNDNNTGTATAVAAAPAVTAIEKKVAEYWNKTANLEKIRTPFNQQRLTAIRARIKEFGEQAFFEAIDAVSKSAFLHGQNNRGWIANFSWVIKPTNFQKTLEGCYNDQQQNVAVSGLKSQDATVQTKKEYSKDF